MEELESFINVPYTDETINSIIQNQPAEDGAVTLHFNQNEQFFLKLTEEFLVPHLPIHHDYREKKPRDDYIQPLRQLIGDIAPLVPQAFKGLTYFFDPGEILRPCFYQIYKIENNYFLYLLRLDLVFKTHEAEIVEKGSNDTTPQYRSSHLFMEADVIPLAEVIRNNGKIQAFKVKQTISQTWIGESGRGYFVQGIWMDSDLTKFFSKLFLPKGKRTYPYYPFTCKYKTICASLVDLSPEARKKYVIYLYKALQIISPQIENIQNSLRNTEFGEEMEEFIEMKKKIPPEWGERFSSISIKRYLNELDMKEYQIAV